MNAQDVIALHGGLATTAELLRAGATSHRLTALVRSETIVRVRQGWYCLPELDPDLQRGIRMGGRLGCVSAVRWHGLAALKPDRVHVCVADEATRLRHPDDYRTRLRERRADVVLHWSRRERRSGRVIQSPTEALTSMAFCQPLERTIAAMDSALRLGLISRAELAGIRAVLPQRLGLAVESVDPRAESITESIARCRLAALGYLPRLQVVIPGVGRVDMMLGERLVLEFDGWAYHGDRLQFERDRRRDAALAARGYRVLRFSYRQVLRRWHEVRDAIEGASAVA